MLPLPSPDSESESARTALRSSPGFTLIELLVTLAIISVLVGLLVPAVQMARESARRNQCVDHLRQIGLALHNYHSTHSILPPGAIARAPSLPVLNGWGWGALLLPQVEQDGLYGQIDFHAPTALGANALVIQRPIALYVCPSESQPAVMPADMFDGTIIPVATGNVAANGDVMGQLFGLRLRDVTDGLSQTLLLGEARHVEPTVDGRDGITVPWCGMLTTIENNQRLIPYNFASPSAAINSQYGFGSSHPGGANFGLADGSARFIAENLDTGIYAAIGTPSGGEPATF